jgi:hypothetical protein
MSGGHIPAHLDRLVRSRARERCEYCRLPQHSQEATFHVDHIEPQAKGGLTVASNLALACVTCSLCKSARTHATDPNTSELAALFHPRRDRWLDHFRWTPGWRLRGKTATGRATIASLRINRPAIVTIRQGLVELGRFP